jgi:GNAT superfamily N-acetyltransferase
MKQRDLSFPREVVLGDASIVHLRPLVAADRDALIAGFQSLSPESRIRRFLFEKRIFSETELHRLTHPDGVDHIAFLAESRFGDEHEAELLAVARCFRDLHNPSLAEVALVTRDDWQGLGLGTALLHVLSEAAWRVGIRSWVASLFSDQRTMRRLLSLTGDVSKDIAVGSGVVEIVCHLHAPTGLEHHQ